MPFIPHTVDEERAMLAEIGADSIEALFDEIPPELRAGVLRRVPHGVSEMEMLRDLGERASRDVGGVCFLGAGCYDHHIPAAVWDLAGRGEFMTAYTPYQAEASQGTLQLIYEFQTMMARLTGLDVSNASVYDGGSGLAEAVLMAVRGNRKVKGSRTVLMAETVHPHYRAAVDSIVGNQGVEIVTVPAGAAGVVDPAALDALAGTGGAGRAEPEFFRSRRGGGHPHRLGPPPRRAGDRGGEPVVAGGAEAAGRSGATSGADIACGDGQPLGIPMSSGGPSFGFVCCKSALVRQMPGRIIGRTVDTDGRTGYTLTLQAREQHIRRGKATSNICTNQGLLVTAATIHMSLLGSDGLAAVARAGAANARALMARLTALPGVTLKFPGGYFHEAVVETPLDARQLADGLLERGILGGLPLGDYFDGMSRALLVCATEKRTRAEIDRYGRALEEVLS